MPDDRVNEHDVQPVSAASPVSAVVRATLAVAAVLITAVVTGCGGHGSRSPAGVGDAHPFTLQRLNTGGSGANNGSAPADAVKPAAPHRESSASHVGKGIAQR